MPFKYNKLKGRITELYGSQSAFAAAIGKKDSYVSIKLKGKVGFSQEDMILWGKALEIPETEFGKYFFA